MTRPLRAAWAVAGRPLSGMPVNGDAAWTSLDGPRLQAAVMDGLGHGKDAADAAERACRCLEALKGSSLEALVPALHEALRRTRGVALALLDADLGAARLRWCGVGNVQGCLSGPSRKERLLNLNGIVGLNLPSSPLVRELPLEPGSLLVLATDGMAEAALWDLPLDSEPSVLAALALRRHALPGDDALLWVGSFHA